MYQHFLMLCVSNLATNPHENLHVMNGLVEKSNSKLSKPQAYSKYKAFLLVPACVYSYGMLWRYIDAKTTSWCFSCKLVHHLYSMFLFQKRSRNHNRDNVHLAVGKGAAESKTWLGNPRTKWRWFMGKSSINGPCSSGNPLPCLITRGRKDSAVKRRSAKAEPKKISS